MKKSVAIVGSGPSALMLASRLEETKFDITIYEKNFAPARKFLVAGDGGFNLTHSEDLEQFIARYTPSSFLENSIRSFTNIDFQNWLQAIGIDTYTGTSKRIFPTKNTKPIDVLNAILTVLKNKNVEIKTQYIWQGWNNENKIIFSHHENRITTSADITVFALGGASWSKTGSDGSWTKLMEEKGIEIIPFQASNCAYEVKWKNDFIEFAEGKSLKNISITCDDKTKKGEVVITKFGLEGGAIYGLSSAIRKQLNENNEAKIFIDLKPHLTTQQIKDKFSARGNRSIKKLLTDRLNFDGVQIELLKTTLTKDEFTDLESLAKKIKNIAITITSAAPIDEAISTVGGIALTEVDEHFQLKKLSNNYCISEMLDWDAPTGGYLLQACFSMGNYLGKYLNTEYIEKEKK